MKAATMLYTLAKLGITRSFSRPSVSNDNAFSESLFRTLKYNKLFPTKPFTGIRESRDFAAIFTDWYNNHHKHSHINFVSPTERHTGKDIEILKNRRRVYE